jgi:hypothetical protein
MATKKEWKRRAKLRGKLVAVRLKEIERLNAHLSECRQKQAQQQHDHGLALKQLQEALDECQQSRDRLITQEAAASLERERLQADLAAFEKRLEIIRSQRDWAEEECKRFREEAIPLLRELAKIRQCNQINSEGQSAPEEIIDWRWNLAVRLAEKTRQWLQKIAKEEQEHEDAANR